MAELSRRIINYEENLKTGNLMLVHLKPFCISSMDNNLKPFEELCRLLKKNSRQVRQICPDCLAHSWLALIEQIFRPVHFTEAMVAYRTI